MRRTLLIAALLCAISTSAIAQEIKNIIFLIGDGMSISAVTMMQIEADNQATVFDQADNIALQRTASLDNRVTDSAAAATALSTGFKTNNTMLAMLPDGTAVETLMELAQCKDMATGIVVTTYVQHATPAAFYAHTPSRGEYLDISRQLLGSDLDIVIGGGMGFFDELYGQREAATEAINAAGFNYIENLSDYQTDSRPLALLSNYEVENRGEYLASATALAIEHLDNASEGFILMVEGSLIDGMAHGNNAEDMQSEMCDFMGAVEVAVEYAKSHPDTLVVVTGDHETGGLSVVSCEADFTCSERGIEYRWTTNGHSAQMVPIYLYGPGAELINGIMENSELGARLREIVAAM